MPRCRSSRPLPGEAYLRDSPARRHFDLGGLGCHGGLNRLCDEAARPVIVYVANYNSWTVTPIRAAANKAGKAIKVGHFPLAIAITPNGQKACASAHMQCGPCLRPVPSACRVSGWWRQAQPGPSTRAISARIRV
jgi:hypothetical protein